jgi:hypothetical protein
VCSYSSHLVAQISPDGALQLGSSFAHEIAQVVQIIAGGNTKLADKILGSRLEIAIVSLGLLIRSAKVCIGRDGRGALEPLQARLGLGLRVGIEVPPSKVLIRRDALLGSELGSGVVGRLF